MIIVPQLSIQFNLFFEHVDTMSFYFGNNTLLVYCLHCMYTHPVFIYYKVSLGRWDTAKGKGNGT